MLLLGLLLAPCLLACVSAQDGPVLDLGYESYYGYNDPTLKMNIWKGLRYARAPVGNLRWQKPQPPVVDRSQVYPATDWAPACPQGNSSPLPAGWQFPAGGLGDEDCLSLSVFAPEDAADLPVMVWIHGGGYTGGQGNYDFSEMVTTNGNGFIYVGIQYRLGAFGFLSSEEIHENGIPNAGLHDMQFALQWVQDQIHKVGGDPKRVTVAGESAGGGGVMHMTIANGGTDGTKYFTNAIVASPFLPMQWNYNDPVPTVSYNNFVELAGCAGQANVFACLQAADTLVLQNASAIQSGSVEFGYYGFVPVTDGEFIRNPPSVQLLSGRVNGLRMLSGNNADEGAGFVPKIGDEDDFNAYIETILPAMSPDGIATLQSVYDIPPTAPGPRFATLGNSGPTALNQSSFATGQQQRALNLYSETTFICPSYWLAGAFPTSWKYQFSPPPAEHASDLNGYYTANFVNPGIGSLSPGFRTAMELIWGRFIMYDDPTLPASVITNVTTGVNGTSTHDDINAAGTGVWPQFKDRYAPGHMVSPMLNLNMTGGTPTPYLYSNADDSYYVTEYTGAGLEAKFDVVDAWSWEGGRGARCERWAELAPQVPE